MPLSTRGCSAPRGVVTRSMEQSHSDGAEYGAQLTDLLSRWESERAKSVDLQIQATTLSGLKEELLRSAEVLSVTRAELTAAKEDSKKVIVEKESVCDELNSLKAKFEIQGKELKACLAENKGLRVVAEENEEAFTTHLKEALSESSLLRDQAAQDFHEGLSRAVAAAQDSVRDALDTELTQGRSAAAKLSATESLLSEQGKVLEEERLRGMSAHTEVQQLIERGTRVAKELQRSQQECREMRQVMHFCKAHLVL
ncbi:unnamed protein product [Choristocarpus tenellus]